RTPPRKHREALHHVEETVGHFIERDFVSLLRQSKTWGELAVGVGKIRTGSNRIEVEIACPTLAPAGLAIAFEEQSGWLVVGVSRCGWLPQLSSARRQVLRIALAGLYKLAGVDLIREQIVACLPAQLLGFDIADEGLVVWPRVGADATAIYDLRSGP